MTEFASVARLNGVSLSSTERQASFQEWKTTTSYKDCEPRSTPARDCTRSKLCTWRAMGHSEQIAVPPNLPHSYRNSMVSDSKAHRLTMANLVQTA